MSLYLLQLKPLNPFVWGCKRQMRRLTGRGQTRLYLLATVSRTSTSMLCTAAEAGCAALLCPQQPILAKQVWRSLYKGPCEVWPTYRPAASQLTAVQGLTSDGLGGHHVPHCAPISHSTAASMLWISPPVGKASSPHLLWMWYLRYFSYFSTANKCKQEFTSWISF